MQSLPPNETAMHTVGEDERASGGWSRFPKDRLHALFLVLALVLCAMRFAWLRADFPNHSPWILDQAKYTDEGWWASGAVRHFLLGHWEVAGDYNPAIAVPMWPLLLTVVFQFTGVSLVAARAVSVSFSLGTVLLVYLLVRRYSDSSAAALAALLLAASPFAFAFSRLATLDTVMVFEFCFLLWIASYANERRVWPLIALVFVIPITLLTKTTALVLFPAVFWLLYCAVKKRATTKRALGVTLIIAALSGAGFGIYPLAISHSRWADDYQYFFDINAMAEVVWKQTGTWALQLLQHGMWVDRLMYPVTLVVFLLSVKWLRGLWKNPLFSASWLALAGQAVFILRRQDDYAPRYFLAMLVPVILVLTLTWQDLRSRSRTMAAVLAAALAISCLLNMLRIAGFLDHRQYQFEDAAKAIQGIVNGDPHQHRMLLGSSGDQLSLMIGIPSINDGYSSEDLAEKTNRYQPGWYIGWNDLDQDILASLSAFRLDKVATFRVYDHEERNLLTLYRMVPVAP